MMVSYSVEVSVSLSNVMEKNECVLQWRECEVLLARKRIKNINLRMDRTGNIKVSAPFKIPLSSIHRFLEEKRSWIMRHRERLLAKPTQPLYQYDSGELHWFMGESYPVIFQQHSQRQMVLFHDNQISCYVKDTTKAAKQGLLEQWYRAQMKALLPALIQKWQPIMGVQVAQWGIKIMKTRWGSCNPRQKRIWLNLTLIKKPLVCLEYVLVHEMVHLLEASHNARFYALMSQFMPEWRAYQKQLE